MFSCARFPKLRMLPAALGLALAGLAFSPSASAIPPLEVLTQNNDNARSGANIAERTLNTSNVNVAQFGKLFTISGLDANVNGQPLYVSSVLVNHVAHNILYVYTSNNTDNSPCSLYAFDADTGTLIWHTPLPNSATYTTATPVIDPATHTLYALTKTGTDDTGLTYLHAVDITTGQEKPGSPVHVQASVPGTGDGNVNGVVSFDGPASNGNRFHANDRAGLLLLGGTVYAGFAHNSDSFPYHGWLLAYHYDGTQFTQTAKFCTTPNGGEGGIWQAGKGLTADTNGYIYCTVGNGTFTANQPGGNEYGMCCLKLNAADLSVADWFAPFDEQSLSDQDLDLGNIGLVGIPGTTRLFGGATKFGSGFLLDSASLGGFTPGGPDKVLDRIDGISGNDNVGQNPVAWDSGSDKYVYVWPTQVHIRQFRYDPSAGNFNPLGIFTKGTDASTSGGSLAISARGTINAILWAVGYDGIVRAYNALDVSKNDLWDSSQNSSRDGLGSVGHFQFPTVVNGKVYVPTGSASIAVYGLLPTPQTTVDQINCGGGAAAPFAADEYVSTQYFGGGTTVSTTAAINTTGVVNPAPQAVYQSARVGNFLYIIPKLTPNAAYTVRLHLAEIVENAPRKRLISATIQGVQVLGNFDIFAVSGGKNKALVEQFTTRADYQGQILVRLNGTASSPDPNAALNGIEVLTLP